jgi:hypothetical protein
LLLVQLGSAYRLTFSISSRRAGSVTGRERVDSTQT